MLINRASKQLKYITLNKQIVIGKDPTVKWKNTLFVSRKKRLIPTYKSILFNSTLKSNLYFPSSTLTKSHICFLMPQKYFTEVLEQWLTNNWPAINSPITKETTGFGCLQPVSVFCIPFCVRHPKYTSEQFKNQRM